MRTGKEHRKSKSRGIMPLAFCVQDHLSQDKFCAKPCKRPLSDGTQALSAVTWLNLNLHRWPEGKGWQWKSQLMFLCPVANPIFWGEKNRTKRISHFYREMDQPTPASEEGSRPPQHLQKGCYRELTRFGVTLDDPRLEGEASLLL